MLTIGLIRLPGVILGHELTRGRDWKLISVPAKGAMRRPLERAITDSRLNAIAIIGLGVKKTRYAEKALSSGKHVLVEFPLSHESKEMSRLQKIAEKRELCLYSPNLLRTESSIQELKRTTSSPSAKLLSLTIVCGMNTRFERSDCTMKLVQLLDLLEWVTGSKCMEANGEKSTNHPSSVAFVVTFSLESGVKGLVNLYSAPSKSQVRLWIDGIFEDSLAHIDPYAQAVRLSRFSDNFGKSVNWAPSSVSIALEDFVACIGGERRPSVRDKMEKLLNLAHSALEV